MYIAVSENFVNFRESTLTVEDPVKHSEKIPVFLNISVPKTACECKYDWLDLRP